MSTAARYPSDFGYAGLLLTADEYLALGETPERYELVHGVVLMSPSAFAEHNEILMEIAHQLKLFAGTEARVRVFPDTDVRFANDTVYRPDISAYGKGRIQGKVSRLTLAPDLAVEVLSAGNRNFDLITKLRDYDRFGVGEYWIIDAANGNARAWTRRDTGFEEVPLRGDALASTAIPGFTLDLRPIRALARGEA